MTPQFQPYGANAAFQLHDAGSETPVKMRNGMTIDPFFFYDGPGKQEDRAYLQLAGDLYHEIHAEGVYDEGIQWAELDVVRFGFKTTHPVLGEIVVSNDTSRSATRASLCSVAPGARLPAVHRSRMHITATAANMPGVILQNQGVPLFLESDELDTWPPSEAVYRFKFQIPLERRDAPGDVVVWLNPGALRLRLAA